MNIAEYICNCLEAYGVKHVFGYPGRTILPLIDAIEKNPQVQWVLMRHEASAAYAASANAKLMQQISVCMATSGPGATNLITGLLDAELDKAPVLVITGLIPSYKHSLSHFQDIDQTYIFKTCCEFSISCEHPLQLPQLLQRAIGYIIKKNRPAHIAIPRDILEMDLSASRFEQKLQRRIELMPPPEEAIRVVAETIMQSKNIIIAVGPRARFAGKNIEELAEKIQAPIVCSFAGKGIINESHANYFGVLGLFGAPANRVAVCAIEKAELVLAFGVDDIVHFLADKDIHQKRELIQCEPDSTAINNQFIQKRILLGNLESIAFNLSLHVTNASPSILSYANQQRQKLIEQEKQIREYSEDFVCQKSFFEKLSRFVNSSNTVIAFDIGDTIVWAIQYLRLTEYQTVLVSNKVGAMGFCLPAIIAAKLAKPQHCVVGICGDGGLQMVLGEITSAVQLKLNIILIVFNNGILQRVVAQKSTDHGCWLKNPNFVELAHDCGASGIYIANNNEIEQKLAEAFAIQKGPVIVEVKCDPQVYAPMME